MKDFLPHKVLLSLGVGRDLWDSFSRAGGKEEGDIRRRKGEEGGIGGGWSRNPARRDAVKSPARASRGRHNS